MTIREKVQAYYVGMASEHHRYRSWEHCYAYFHRSRGKLIEAEQDHAALQLGFYLASWGMYRGSSFLLQHAYTVHKGVVANLTASRFSALWEHEFGGTDKDEKLVPLILEVISGIREAYKPFAPMAESGQPTDTLVTKILLGTFGCLPACDRFFIDGFKAAGLSYSYLNPKFIERVLRFCRDNLYDLREEQARIDQLSGMRYPLMKLVDMYFWQIGFERSTANIDSAQASALA